MLRFLGRNSGFSDSHTAAYFTTRDSFVLIDCGVSAFQKLMRIDFSNYRNIYVLITHTHGDHIGGLGLFIQFAYWTLKKKVMVVAPSEDVLKDIVTVLDIEGNEREWYDIFTSDKLETGHDSFYRETILTAHSPQLEGKCFGYWLDDGTDYIIYTGDTATLEPFSPYLSDLRNTVKLYVDVSVWYGMIHLKLAEILEELKFWVSKGVCVYLMHLDDEEEARRLTEGTGIELAPMDE